MYLLLFSLYNKQTLKYNRVAQTNPIHKNTNHALKGIRLCRKHGGVLLYKYK